MIKKTRIIEEIFFSSRKFNTTELLQLLRNGENQDHRRIFYEFVSSALMNCLNYQVTEETRMAGAFFKSSRKFNLAKGVKLSSNEGNKHHRRIIYEVEVVQPN